LYTVYSTENSVACKLKGTIRCAPSAAPLEVKTQKSKVKIL
jgi:hypothetical protein